MIKKIKILYNVITSFINYKRKKITLSNKPTLYWLEPTNKCNINCVMCPNDQFTDEQLGFMDLNVYYSVIDKIKDGASSIYLLVSGESLLHKDIYTMIKYARNNNVRPLVNTNATTLVSERQRIGLLTSGVEHVTFAFDGYDKESYEKVRVGAKYDAVMSGVKAFLLEKKKRKLKVPFVAITTLEVGLSEYDNIESKKQEFFQQFDGLPVDEFISKKPNTWGSNFSDTDLFETQKPDPVFNPCGHLWSTMTILWDGTVVPCCFDFFQSYPVGNITKQSVDEIWNGDPMKKLRSSMMDKTYTSVNSLCDGCLIPNLNPVLGVPAGMRSALKDAVTNTIGISVETRIKQFARLITKTYSLKVEKKTKAKKEIKIETI
jgi:radical SAM protein with 4Fe4S-binding SPASM domain